MVIWPMMSGSWSSRSIRSGSGPLSGAVAALLRRDDVAFPCLPAGRPIKAVIPEKTDQAAHRKRTGSRSGRPITPDATLYKDRNTVERCIKKLKTWRGPATRSDKPPTAASPDSTSAAPSSGSAASAHHMIRTQNRRQMTINIRRSRPEDHAAILSLMDKARGAGLGDEERARRGFVQGNLTDELLHRFHNGPGIFVADAAGELAGFRDHERAGLASATTPGCGGRRGRHQGRGRTRPGQDLPLRPRRGRRTFPRAWRADSVAHSTQPCPCGRLRPRRCVRRNGQPTLPGRAPSLRDGRGRPLRGGRTHIRGLHLLARGFRTRTVLTQDLSIPRGRRARGTNGARPSRAASEERGEVGGRLRVGVREPEARTPAGPRGRRAAGERARRAARRG